jgi:DNA-binding HxlR family transcriptional regulator
MRTRSNQKGDLSHALEMVGDRWALQIVAELLEDPQRFGELADRLGGIAPNILTARLRHLERAGLLTATPYTHRPMRMRYALTDTGRDLGGALALLRAWGARQRGDHDGPLHSVCGTPLETRLYCPTCETPADEIDTEPVAWL